MLGTPGWRRAKLCDCAISRKPVLPKLAENSHEAAGKTVTTKELAATIGAGGYKPRPPRSEVASTGGHDEASIPHSKLKRPDLSGRQRAQQFPSLIKEGVGGWLISVG